MTTMDLTDFLLARIAEDEDIARRAAGPVWVMGADREGGPGRWRHVAQLVALPAADPTDTLSIGDELLRAEHGHDSARAFRSVQHVVRWDPARVLAECEAKRRIVEDEAGARVLRDDAPDHEVRTWSDEGHSVFVNGERMDAAEYERLFTEPAPPSLTLRLLALPYADHPDYREEWRP